MHKAPITKIGFLYTYKTTKTKMGLFWYKTTKTKRFVCKRRKIENENGWFVDGYNTQNENLVVWIHLKHPKRKWVVYIRIKHPKQKWFVSIRRQHPKRKWCFYTYKTPKTKMGGLYTYKTPKTKMVCFYIHFGCWSVIKGYLFTHVVNRGKTMVGSPKYSIQTPKTKMGGCYTSKTTKTKMVCFYT